MKSTEPATDLMAPLKASVEVARSERRDRRVSELSRMPKSRLAPLWRQHHPNAWTAHPVETWNKDELINDILRAEFPTAGTR